MRSALVADRVGRVDGQRLSEQAEARYRLLACEPVRLRRCRHPIAGRFSSLRGSTSATFSSSDGCSQLGRPA